MADRSIRIVIGANVTGLVNGLRTAETAARDFGTRTQGAIERNQQSIGQLSNTIGLMGLALTGLAGLSIKRFADFDQAMSNVKATGDDAAAAIGGLRDIALEAGKTTVYSAKEAAGGIEELIKAGVSASDVLGGGLTGALDLAAAGELSVSEAAETAAMAMSMFNLEGEDVAHVADLLAAGAANAQGTVHDLGYALKMSGLVADSTGLSIEETTAGLTAFANAGLVGSDAGTSFKSMLQRLTPQSAEAQKKMDELGISAYDSQGQFIGLARLAGNLQTSMKDLTPEARNSALAVMFGSDAVRAANVLYEEGEGGIRQWIKAVDDQGFAAETAATRLDNLNGDLKKLKGSIDVALIGIGEGANGPLRDLVQGVTEAVNSFSELPAEAQNATLAIVGGGGLVLLGIAGMGKLAVSISNVRTALSLMGVSAGTSGALVAGVAAVVAVGAVAFAKWSKNAADARARTEEYAATLDEMGDTTDQTIETITTKLAGADFGRGLADKLMGDDSVNMLDWANDIGIATDDVIGYILGQEEAVKTVTDSLQAYDDAWDIGPKDEDKMKALKEELDAQASSLSEAEKAAARKAQADEELGIAEKDLTGEVDATTLAVEEQTTAVEELWDAHMTLAGNALSVRDAQRGLEDAFVGVNESIEAQITDLASQYVASGMSEEAARARAEAEVAVASKLDITTEAGRRNQEALDGIAEAGLTLVDSMRAAGDSEANITAAAESARAKFVEQATALGMSSDEANALADEVGLAVDEISKIPTSKTVNLAITTTGYDQLQAVQAQINAIPGQKNVRVAMGPGGSGGITFANGGFFKSFADGGVENHTAQIAKGGSYRLWAESETGGEAYIPLALSKRARSLDIWAQTGKHLGVKGYADGGVAYRYPTSAMSSSAAPAPVVVELGDIYVQNPWTGEQVIARVRGVVGQASEARSAGVRAGGRR